MDWVSRGSMTGGSQAEARVRTPPRLGGAGLAAIQSGYSEAAADLPPPATASADMPAVVQPARLRKLRRLTWREALAGRVGIGALLAVRTVRRKETAGHEVARRSHGAPVKSRESCEVEAGRAWTHSPPR